MRACLLLLVAAGCDPTFDPSPPSRLPWAAHSLSASGGRTMIVTATGLVEFEGSPVPLPTDDNGAALALELPPVLDGAVGVDHACAIATNGSPFCWGDHANGALGSTRACTPDPNGGAPECMLNAEAILTLPAIRALAAGTDFTCGIAFDDRVFCWGRGGPWLGGSAVPAFSPPTPVMRSGEPLLASRLIASRTKMCAIDHDATAWCWGETLGAAPVHQLDGVVDLSLGARHGCAITAGGLTCWGDNTNGQCGDLEAAHACGSECRVEATRIELPAKRVVVGERHTCALVEDGGVWCWGSNEVGQLGRTDAFLLGDRGLILDNAVDLVAGYSHTCALGLDGGAWCWGEHLSSL